ncbi:MFS transporter [uncultured Amnibacterium sp.]|uniref:MFS transporter n=1 Tax=uncultured Amnibacterium sp. TaxID=1631851 RepID=UPI0035CB3684
MSSSALPSVPLLSGGALADPTSAAAPSWGTPQRGLLFFIALAAVGGGMAQLVPAVLTLSIKANAIDPAHATTVLSIASAIGAAFSIVALPAFGRISDRSLSRFGRRRPLLVTSAILMALGAVLTLLATSTLVLTIASTLTMVGFSAGAVAVTAIIPDQLAPTSRGPASAIVGLSLPLGAVLGLFIAQAVSGMLAAMILLPASVGVLGALVLAIVLHDRRQNAADRSPFGVTAFFSTFWVSPLTHPSFASAWISRILIFFGVGCVQAYQAFYLLLVLHFSVAEVPGAIFLSILVLTGTALVFAPIAAKISDRVKRRKPFVVAAAVIFATGLILVATATSYPSFLLAMAVVGFGQGIYFAVDLALITQILPDPQNPAKDLGIMNLATVLPAAVVPAIAPAVLAIGASAATPQNFPALFILGAVAGLVGAAFILPIKGVR